MSLRNSVSRHANEARLIRKGAVSYLEKSSLENSEALLQNVDDALHLHRQDEFRLESSHPKGTRTEEATK